MLADYRHYVKASYEIVSYAKTNIQPELDQTLESYLVELIARHFKEHNFGEKPVAISILESSALPDYQKKQSMAAIGDECLFIHGFGIKKKRWPSETYYQNMGKIAYGSAAIAINPEDRLYLHLEDHFEILGTVLNQFNRMVK